MLFVRIAGWLLILTAIADIFFTVLYVGSGVGLLSPVIGKRGWILFRLSSVLFGRFRRVFLSLAGPTLLIVIAVTWSFILAIGFALVFWPDLDVSLQKSQGVTPTGFLTALYYSGFSLSTLGIGDVVPTANHTRLLTVLEAGLGFSFFTLTITYILSVYSALQRRNTLASILAHKTAGTGNAGILVADMVGAGARQGGPDLSDLACRVADLLESHKFYSVLHYFHFLQKRYSLPRMILTLMDTATLLKVLSLSGREDLNPSITQLKTAGDNLLDHLTDTFHSRDQLGKYQPGPKEIQQWRNHFSNVVEILDRGERPLPHPGEAEENYIALRSEWFPYIARFADFLGYRLEEILAEEDI